ncbi:NAD(P)/FAD-dependent oxidoreductase [Oceanicoccus sp. KOV_DT_Chl]|uniref:phytoene desaturase family protein n=1 Tax=Oceanicoccus sp. KOV_DT_Chl TaxID=1904639 RepID=UPI000C7CE4A3|nr:NAD(P)/FAD-dependent oxidoreductase [Oceanicoccus sp. KOV_DT_Chl]
MTDSAATTASIYDAIVIGAGHNGLAAATVLARHGHSVLVLEKNNYVGGMGGTREILKGCRNEVGASCLFPLSAEVKAYFDFEALGVELIPLPIMAVNLCGGAKGRPLIFYKNPLKLAFNIFSQFGFSGMLGFIRLMAFCKYPADMLHRFTARKVPLSLQQIIDQAPDAHKRAQLELAFTGSAMDIIDKFLPDKIKHKELRANMAFAAVQATYKGPYTEGSGMCLIYTLAQEGSGGLMQRVKGGMGKLSEALVAELERLGAEVRLKQQVKRIVVEDGQAVGVELKTGELIRAAKVISNLDKPATFAGLMSDSPLEPVYQQRLDRVEHHGAFVHMLFKLKALPDYVQSLDYLNRVEGAKFGGAMVLEPEQLQQCYEACLRGELPEQVPLAFQMPTVMDASLAPAGAHIASAYGFYFPCDAPKEQRGKLRDQMAERIIAHISEYYPNFAELITDKAIFSSDHFASMHGATQGDWTHGSLHPEYMMADRCMVAGSAHKTPVGNLFLCGSSCHPGPGVTFLPGYSCAHEVMCS